MNDLFAASDIFPPYRAGEINENAVKRIRKKEMPIGTEAHLRTGKLYVCPEFSKARAFCQKMA